MAAPSGIQVSPSQLAAMASARGLDPNAVLAVARQEGLGGGIGDQGTSFGPFQLHYGGAYPSSAPQGAAASQQWAWSPQGVNYALGRIGQVAGGLQGPAAVRAIVTSFERPANPSSEIAGALGALGQGVPGGGVSLAPISGASPRLPSYNMPPSPSNVPLSSMPSSSILPSSSMFSATGGLGNLDVLGSAGKALGMTTPMQQAQASGVRTATSPNGNQIEVQGKVAPRDLAAVHLAEHFIGTPYQWGGSSPSGFDCSGLLQYVWGQQGVQIPRTTYEQFQAGTPVAKSKLQPGDAVYFTGSDPQGDLPGHVGMYIGGGKFVEAPHTGADVRVSNLAGRSDYVGARSFA
jgi:cell wall-associated NlpC family hydrolase